MLRRGGEQGTGEAGAVAILVAMFSIIMFVFAALIVDLGFARTTRRDAQNAADAAALAAANALYPSGSTPNFAAAVQAAKDYAASNFHTSAAEWSSCTTTLALSYVPAGGSSCISFDSATTPANVKVIVPARLVKSFFGGVVGYSGLNITALAQAQVDRGSNLVCAFCVLGPSHTLQNADLSVTNGDFWINGDLSTGPQGKITATNATARIQGTVSGSGTVSSPKVNPTSAVTDPLASMSVPPSDIGTLVTTVRTDPCSHGPGYYGAVSLSGNGTCTLAAGLYVFTEPFSLGGNQKLVANDVTLYFACGTSGVRGTCAADASPGQLLADGKDVTITAPTSGARKGLAIVYDRGNTGTLGLTGLASGGAVTGTIYAPDATFNIQGNGCGATVHSVVVIKTFSLNGNSTCFKTTYSAADNVGATSTDTGLVL